jgi:hypothetical protein
MFSLDTKEILCFNIQTATGCLFLRQEHTIGQKIIDIKVYTLMFNC